jgi:hypothetical protein
MVDTLLAIRASSADLLLRARLGATAKDPDLVRVTLYEIVPGLEARGGPKATVDEALRILDSVPGGDPQSRERLRALLAAVAERPASAGAARPAR